MNNIINVLKGIAIGIANAVPGVSGGTIAVILKIYDRLLGCLTVNVKKIIKEIKFILPLGIGVLIGIVLASKVLSWLFQEHNIPTQLFFLGVIIGSLPLILRECTKETKLKPYHLVPFLLTGAGMFCFNSFLSGTETAAETLSPIAIILMTAIAAAAMIMPGLSGALVLKVLGGYDLAIRSVSSFDVVTLMFYAIGAVIGLLAAAKIISVLLEKCRCGTYCAILGLIVGSAPAVFPSGFAFNTEGIIGIAALVVGLALPFLMELPNKNKTDETSVRE